MAGSDSMGGTQAGLPQPQTTVEPPGGPFVRHSQPGRRSLASGNSLAYGSTFGPPFVAAPGYYSRFRIRATGTGGTGSTAAATADAPYSFASLVTLKDGFGTPLIVAPGWETFYLLPKYGGQFGTLWTRDIGNLPSFGPGNTGTQGQWGVSPVNLAGNWAFNTVLPLEFAKAYGVISGANASLLPTLTINLAASSAVYSTAPGGSPVVNIAVDSDFYWLPEGVSVEPPGLGSTCQWVFQQCSPTIGSGSSTIVQAPRMGGYLSEMIFILRDSTGARVDAWPSRFRLLVDGVPLIDSDITEIFDDMAIQFQGTGRPVGVIAISRSTGLGLEDHGLFDTGEQYLSTNPGTQIEVQGAPWGTVTNAPMTLSVLFGQIVPSGTLIQGLPEM